MNSIKKNQESANAVKFFFDGYAEKFYSIYLEDQKNPFKKLIDRYLRYSMFLRFQKVSEIIKSTSSSEVLDVGCGPGWHDFLLAKYNNVKVTGIDVAPNMIKISRKLSSENNMNTKLEFIIADIMDYQFDRDFDTIFALGVVEYFEDPESLIDVLRNIVSKRILFSVPVENHWLTPQRKIRYKLRNCPLWFYNKSRIKDILTNLSLSNYQIHDLGRDYLVEIIF